MLGCTGIEVEKGLLPDDWTQTLDDCVTPVNGLTVQSRSERVAYGALIMASHARIVYAPSLTSEETCNRCCPGTCWQQLASPLRSLDISPALFWFAQCHRRVAYSFLGEGNGQEVFCLAQAAGAAGEVFAVTPSRHGLINAHWQNESGSRSQGV